MKRNWGSWRLEPAGGMRGSNANLTARILRHGPAAQHLAVFQVLRRPFHPLPSASEATSFLHDSLTRAHRIRIHATGAGCGVVVPVPPRARWRRPHRAVVAPRLPLRPAVVRRAVRAGRGVLVRDLGTWRISLCTDGRRRFAPVIPGVGPAAILHETYPSLLRRPTVVGFRKGLEQGETMPCWRPGNYANRGDGGGASDCICGGNRT
ncbi:MAG: hypothetical protein RLY70_2383 [Planctomycetota bacterium]